MNGRKGSPPTTSGTDRGIEWGMESRQGKWGEESKREHDHDDKSEEEEKRATAKGMETQPTRAIENSNEAAAEPMQ